MSAIMSKSAMLRQYELEHEIENAARRLDVWAEAGPMSCRGAWYMFERAGKYAVEKIGPIGDGWEKWDAANTGARDVPAPTAALFLLLLGLPNVAVTCPDCKAKRYQEQGLKASVSVWLSGPGWHWWAAGLCWRRRCPTCTVDGAPTGKVTREPARLLLDAMPTEGTPPDRGLDVQTRDVEPPPGVTLGSGERWVQDVHPRARGLDFPIESATPGDPIAREHLAILADELQASGNPRGEWLALWLRGAVETEAGHTMPIDTALPAIAVALRDLQ